MFFVLCFGFFFGFFFFFFCYLFIYLFFVLVFLGGILFVFVVVFNMILLSNFYIFNHLSKLDFCSEETNITLRNKTSVTVASPLFPVLYPNNMDCTWRIFNVNTSFILLTFQEVKLNRVDQLLIGNGADINSDYTIMTMHDENGHPNPTTINSTQIWIAFKSDREERRKGFSLAVRASDVFGMYSVAARRHLVVGIHLKDMILLPYQYGAQRRNDP